MPEGTDLRDALARALGDPELELVFWTSDRYVDRSGSPVELPAVDDARRTVTEIDHQGERIAAIVHHRAQDARTIVRPARPRPCSPEPASGGRAAHPVVELRAGTVAVGPGRRRRAPAPGAQPARRRTSGLVPALTFGSHECEWPTAPTPQSSSMRSIGELAESLEELRDLARCIHPAGAPSTASNRRSGRWRRALRSRSRSLCMLTVASPPPSRPPPTSCSREALTNGSKYARAGACTIRVERVDGHSAGRGRRRRRAPRGSATAPPSAACPIASRRSARRSRSRAHRPPHAPARAGRPADERAWPAAAEGPTAGFRHPEVLRLAPASGCRAPTRVSGIGVAQTGGEERGSGSGGGPLRWWRAAAEGPTAGFRHPGGGPENRATTRRRRRALLPAARRHRARPRGRRASPGSPRPETPRSFSPRSARPGPRSS